jgi:hypothetical protein
MNIDSTICFRLFERRRDSRTTPHCSGPAGRNGAYNLVVVDADPAIQRGSVTRRAACAFANEERQCPIISHREREG